MTEYKDQAKKPEDTVPDNASNSKKKAEENKSKPDAAEERQKQIDSWQKKIDSGEATLGEVTHEWLRKELKPGQTDLEQMISRKVEEGIKARADQERETKLGNDLTELKLNAEALKEAQAEVDRLVESGLNKTDALQNVIRTEQKVLNAIAKREKGNYMSMTPAGSAPESNGKTLDSPDITDDEIRDIVTKMKI